MKNLQLSTHDGHAILTFDREGSSANIFDSDTLNELIEAFTKIKKDVSINSLQLRSNKPKIFIAGADIHQLMASTPGELAAMIDLGHEAFQLLEDLRIPTIATIHGACLGGGYELALACDWRIASDDKCTKVGLPETKLGILPAWGGSTRLPRLIGLPKALPLILGGKVLKAHGAKNKKLIDDIVPKEHLDRMAKEFLSRGKRDAEDHPILHNAASVRLIEAQARKDIMHRTRGRYPAPLKALEVICQSVCHTPEVSFRNEREAVIELASQTETTHLIDLFLLNDKAKKLKLPDTTPVDLKQPAILGSGIMGSGIAYWLSSHHYPVLLQDINDEILAKGMANISDLYSQAVQRHSCSQADARTNFDRIHANAEKIPLHNRDLIIEAAVENLDVKKQIFADLSSRCSDTCILATNTSALPIRELAEVVSHPERIIGLHFFNPVPRMPLVEIVRAPTTSQQTLATVIQFVQRIGKTPIVVKDSPGFLVNRILVPYLLEACRIFASGISPEQIDEAMLDFGMPMGPLRLLDEVGLDVGSHVAGTLIAAYADRMSIPPLLSTMIDAGYLGRKSGQGFYNYQAKKPTPNPEALALREHRNAPDEEIAERLAHLMSAEAARCLDEKIADSAASIDFAMVMGTGYAPFRGGPLHYADASRSMRPDFYPTLRQKTG
jgi:3-hydroxyacyl-CoA dehydrogenase/enoyl-CoA hydratase/3-hydroxybutyryl-CoA epimerase